MDTYFLRKSIYQTSDPDWAQRYLYSSKDRITALLKEDLGNEFWQRYAKIYDAYCASGKLLFRAKAITGTAMTLVQIWRSQADQKAFDAEVYAGVNFLSVLRENGLEIVSEGFQINRDQAIEQIEHIRKLPHLLQFVCEDWRTQGMVVGDPLKVGRGYLPFPEN